MSQVHTQLSTGFMKRLFETPEGNFVVVDGSTNGPYEEKPRRQPPRRSWFHDDVEELNPDGHDHSEENPGFTWEMRCHGQHFFGMELSPLLLCDCRKREQQIGELMEYGAQAPADERPGCAWQMHELMVELFDLVLTESLRTWDLCRPNGEPVLCCPAAARRLHMNLKAEIYSNIMQLSLYGLAGEANPAKARRTQAAPRGGQQ